MKKGTKDFFSKQAKQDNYLARAAYKLIELDKKHDLFSKKKQGTLVEFGISPGSWYQVYLGKIHPETKVIGIDLKPFKGSLGKGVFINRDIFDLELSDLKPHCQGPVLWVLSDALPNLTGNRLRDRASIEQLRDHVTRLSMGLLNKGGILVIKTFDTPSHRNWFQEQKSLFKIGCLEKPKASRKESPEIYFVGKGYLGPSL